MSQAEKLYELVASCSDSALMLVSFNFMLGPNLRKITTKVSYRGCVLAANRSPFPSRSERSIAGVNMSRDTYSAYLCIKTMSYPLHAQHAIFSVEQRLATEGKFFSKDWQLLQACHVQTDRSFLLGAAVPHLWKVPAAGLGKSPAKRYGTVRCPRIPVFQTRLRNTHHMTPLFQVSI